MRYELSDYEWTAIKPMLPNKPRGVRCVTTVACSMASFGFCVQVRRGATRQRPMAPVPSYNRFVRWRRAGVWDQIIDALVAGACPREAAVAIRRAAAAGAGRGQRLLLFPEVAPCWLPFVLSRSRLNSAPCPRRA